MFSKTRRLLVVPALCALPLACSNNESQIGVAYPIPDTDSARATLYKGFAYMGDNALLDDMALADTHFILHTDELSGMGEVRLERMVPLLNTYGGTVRYETSLTDETMIEERIEHAREYLVSAGCDMDRIEVRAMMSGGRGMPAKQAIEKRDERAAAGDEELATAIGGLTGG